MDLSAFDRELERYSATAHEGADAQLESECLALLGRVDFILQRLDELPSRQELDSIEAGREVLVEVLEFLSNQRGADALTDELARVCATRDMMKRYEKELKGWPLARMFGWTPSRQVHEGEYMRIGKELRGLCSDLLGSVNSMFAEQDRLERVQDCCEALMNNMERLW